MTAEKPTFDALIDRYSRAHPRLFFVQVGGFDGESYDPIRPLIVRDAWRGIILEPNPVAFAKLAKLYTGSSTVRCLPQAIAPVSGTMTLHYVPPDATKLEWAASIGTLAPDKGRIHEFGEAVRQLEVPCLPLSQLVRDHALTEIDLLQIDVEGFDFEVIKSLDFSAVKPRIIHWEDRHLKGTEQQDCMAFLSGHGYTVFQERHPNDSTAYLPDAVR